MPEDGYYTMIGDARASEKNEKQDDERPEWAARILIPDPEYQSGWGAYWIKRKPPEKPKCRVGFKRA